MQHISAMQVTLMLVGTLVGAGFASGREMWVYFGSFGTMGYVGLLLFALSYLGVCTAALKLAYKIKSNEFGEVIVPQKYHKLSIFIKYYITVVLWGVLICMTAAGGSVASQQFGIPKAIGGIVVAVLVIFTVFGDFDRVSRAFRYVMPLLMAVIIISCIAIIVTDLPETGYTNEVKHATLGPTWYISALLYFCFNMTGSVSVSIIVGYRTDDISSAKRGIRIATLFCVVLGALMITACLKDPSFSEAMDMPLLGYAALVSKPLNIAFAAVMMLAIYASATSNFYACTTEIKEGKNKRLIIIIIAAVAYGIGLAGFKNIVNYMFSIFGIIGISILVSLLVNYYLNFVKKTEDEIE